VTLWVARWGVKALGHQDKPCFAQIFAVREKYPKALKSIWKVEYLYIFLFIFQRLALNI
jgi:hypothetical protein